MRVRLLAAAVGLVAIAGSCSRRAVASRDAGFATFVDTVATAELRVFNAPSVTIAVARGADIIVLKSYGMADEEHAVPATPETVYPIGSVSKQFTAATIMRLVEQHRIALDDDVTTYLRQFYAHGALVTIRQLLSHTSGVQDFTSVPEFAKVERLDLTGSTTVIVLRRSATEPICGSSGGATTLTSALWPRKMLPPGVASTLVMPAAASRVSSGPSIRTFSAA